MSIDVLLSRFEGVRGKAPRWRAICCVHESKHRSRSVSIYEPEPDRILIHCHAGCSVADIAAKLGIELSDLFPPRVDDDQRKPRIKRAWRASEVLDSLQHELHVAFVTLTDVIAGHPVDFNRARVARDRIVATIRELTHAH